MTHRQTPARSLVRRLARLALLAGSALIVTGCGERSKGPYPSLLPRPIESRSDAEPEIAPVMVEADSALDKRVAGISATIDSTQKDFAIAATKADSLSKAAQGQPVGSDRWIEAQSALADLDVFRASTVSALSDLDDAAMTRAADGKPPYPSLEAARTATQKELDVQTARIATLQTSLPEAR
ncbi:MAG: hypothetical protein V4564_25355 [Pseudomonadota bacterium]